MDDKDEETLQIGNKLDCYFFEKQVHCRLKVIERLIPKVTECNFKCFTGHFAHRQMFYFDHYRANSLDSITLFFVGKDQTSFNLSTNPNGYPMDFFIEFGFLQLERVYLKETGIVTFKHLLPTEIQLTKILEFAFDQVNPIFNSEDIVQLILFYWDFDSYLSDPIFKPLK